MTTPPLRLFLVRHGETDHNAAMRYIGRTDVALNAAGRRQARALGSAFRRLRVDRVLTSPLRRARDTALEIAHAAGVSLQVDPRLQEMDFGRWEGLTRAEVHGRSPHDAELLTAWEANPWMSPSGGTGLDQVEASLEGLLKDLAATRPRYPVVLVSHVGPLKTLLSRALGDGSGGFRRIFLDPATISVVDWGKRPLIRLVNSHAHLGWGAARWMEE